MADDSPMRMQKKTRSASICATGASIETVIHNMPTGSATPDGGGTPNYRRRRPATRSQSARITPGSRSVRRRPQQQQQPQQHNLQETRSYCTSEPRLSETETPPQSRKLSQRRPQSSSQKKPNSYLNVPNNNMFLRVSDDDDEIDRLRTFSASKGGVINRGDSFRRRRSRSNSLAPVSPQHTRNTVSSNGYHDGYSPSPHHKQKVDVYRVEMMGSSGVGKQALVAQFRTSDCINAYDGPECEESEQNISIILNGIESELQFSIGRHENKEELEKADAILVVYSCIDKESFTKAKQTLIKLQDMDLIRKKSIILVANKIDLARSRAVSSQDGKYLACTFQTKFIEVSVGINHNCDELLAGTLTQIRLKKEQLELQLKKIDKLKAKAKDHRKPLQSDSDSNIKNKNFDHVGHRETPSPPHWYKSRSVVMATMKVRQAITWVIGKEDPKFKNCENLQVL